MTGKVGLSYFEKNTPYANFTPIDANQSVHQKEAFIPVQKKRMEILTSKSRLTMGGFLIR